MSIFNRGARLFVLVSLPCIVSLVVVGCSNQITDSVATALPTQAVATASPVDDSATSTPTETAMPTVAPPPLSLEPGDPVPPEILAAAETAWGPGGVYVASLPRPNDVPAGWLPARSPQFQERSPAPGETYSFACENLPARSTGVATVGYRSLEGLPSISIEYVLYPTPEGARDALNEMRLAAESCGSFTVASDGTAEEVTATMSPLTLPALGDSSFAVLLETGTATTGDLTTHVYKILRDNVVIGINHAARSSDPTPDAAVSESVGRLAVTYLDQLD